MVSYLAKVMIIDVGPVEHPDLVDTHSGATGQKQAELVSLWISVGTRDSYRAPKLCLIDVSCLCHVVFLIINL